MPKAKDLSKKVPSILLVAPPVQGKTSFMLTGGDALELLDCDGNARSGLCCRDGLDEERGEAEVLDCSGPGCFKAVEARIVAVEKALKEGKPAPRILAIDTLAPLTESALWHMKNTVPNANRPFGNRLPDQSDYRLMGYEVFALIDRLRALPITTILAAHHRTDLVNVNDNPFGIVATGSLVPENLPRKFTDIWQIRTTGGGGKQQFQLYTQPQGAVLARNSAGLSSPLDASKGLKAVLALMGVDLTPQVG